MRPGCCKSRRTSFRTVVGSEIADTAVGQADPLLSQFLTGDQNIIQVRTVVQYSVATPADYLFRAEEVEPAVRGAVEMYLAENAGGDCPSTEELVEGGFLNRSTRSTDCKRQSRS